MLADAVRGAPGRWACVTAVLLALLGGLAADRAHAEGWPLQGKPVTIVSAYPAGGFSDVIARVLGERLTEKLKVAVIVENRPGAGGQLAASHVKQQPADGHTLWLGDVGPPADICMPSSATTCRATLWGWHA